MITAWTKHLSSPKEKEQYKQSLLRVKWVLDDLKRLTKENATSIEQMETTPKSYDNPNWPYRQAHANGYKQCLRDFNKLLTLEENNG